MNCRECGVFLDRDNCCICKQEINYDSKADNICSKCCPVERDQKTKLEQEYKWREDNNTDVSKIEIKIHGFISENFTDDYSPEQVKEALERIIQSIDEVCS